LVGLLLCLYIAANFHILLTIPVSRVAAATMAAATMAATMAAATMAAAAAVAAVAAAFVLGLRMWFVRPQQRVRGETGYLFRRSQRRSYIFIRHRIRNRARSFEHTLTNKIKK